MRVEKLGEGEPEYAVVGGVHGDEPCGKRAIERFVESDLEVEKPVKLVVANERALEKDARYVECDLNRSFPGDISGDKHEDRLAARILEHVQGLKTLALHSTRSYSEPFAAMSTLDRDKMELIRKTGVEAVSAHGEEIGCLSDHENKICVECGLQGSEAAVENAYRVMKNFLAACGVIDQDFRTSRPEVFQIYETIERPEFDFTGTNFRKVEEGEAYAKDRDRVLRAEESFYPVLMSNEGYENILGHKARKIEDRYGEKA